MRHVHFIGIGGSGLSAIARVLLERGIMVSGSDRQETPFTRDLQEAGAKIIIGHHQDNILGADLVLRSSAVPDDNVEVRAALSAGIPVLKRIDFLTQLMAGHQGIAIAGTHGKTTTTAMIAWMLTDMGLDPSFVIGGVSANLGVNARAGSGSYFVIEADEYDRMFLGIHPRIAVVTSVEHDHPDFYPTPESFYGAFQEFVDRLQPDGTLVGCGDDIGASKLLSYASAVGLQALSYGISGTNHDFRADNLTANEVGGFDFDIFHGNGKEIASVSLQVPGEHNVNNALAALTVAFLLKLPVREAAKALSDFLGTGRRFEVRGVEAGVTVIDDYAHHPTEIRATLRAARRRYPDRTIWAVWQPHTYSRTRTLFKEYLSAFDDADHLLVTEVYAARELPPADGFSAIQFVEAFKGILTPASPDALFVSELSDTSNFLLDHLMSGDIVLVLSAGDADQISTQLVQALSGRNLS